ncbi:hypothetical protein [Prochlorococcus marinus]|uniref:Uncharacterized protein n=1 Tax=Prochlorococcus marinus (strain MIT 9211) TaxID=93059 RepID=A9BB05_PROM4|nr:hypothetical protein [Prochlorococcus marinus]ABX09017.1 Hypothetical protein P9211_10861 [Prochlorococcus marinus str. MIT 9211]
MNRPLTTNLYIILLMYTGLFLVTGKANSEETNDLVTMLCMASFKAQMQFTKEKPLDEMGDFACKCFVKQINSGLTINKARNLCKEEATKRFNFSKQN